VTRLKWLWWKFWAWLTTPWAPEDKLGNPRSKKRRENPFYRPALWFMYCLNALTLYLIFWTIVFGVLG
jgi:hypothetical protein